MAARGGDFGLGFERLGHLGWLGLGAMWWVKGIRSWLTIAWSERGCGTGPINFFCVKRNLWCIYR
jgi:hypothetical protein